jgi:hypothetical protein
MKTESVVFCEGFHDRAFWKGWLFHLGCTDPGAQLKGASTRRPVSDPWGGNVIQGRFAFNSPTGHFIQVSPCGGKSNLIPLVRQRLKKHTTEPVRRIVVNEDSDLPAGAAADMATPASVEAVVKDFDPAATQSPPANGSCTLGRLASRSSAGALPIRRLTECRVSKHSSASFPPQYVPHMADAEWLYGTGWQLDPIHHRTTSRNLHGHIWRVGMRRSEVKRSTQTFGMIN